MRAAARRLGIGALLLLAACSNGEPRVTATVQGSSFTRVPPAGSTYAIATVPFVIRNRGENPVVVPTCGSQAAPIIDRFDGGHWEQYSGGACVVPSTQGPIVLTARQSDTSLVTIGEGGRYRLRVTYGYDAAYAKTGVAVSGSFDVQ